jgi:hypothetical protein
MTKYNEFLQEFLQESLLEMAYDSGVNDQQNYSKKKDWSFYKGRDKTQLIAKDLGGSHYKIYFSGLSSYFLTTEDDEYLGQLEGRYSENTFYISSSQSDVKGFYQIMFISLLAKTNIKHIISDISLSTQAIGSYEKLAKNNLLKTEILCNNKIIPFSKEVLLSKPSCQVMVSSNTDLQEHFYNFYNKVNMVEQETNRPLAHNVAFNNREKYIDNVLFGEIL